MVLAVDRLAGLLIQFAEGARPPDLFVSTSLYPTHQTYMTRRLFNTSPLPFLSIESAILISLMYR